MNHIWELTHRSKRTQEVTIIEFPTSQSYRVNLIVNDHILLTAEYHIWCGPTELREEVREISLEPCQRFKYWWEVFIDELLL